MYEVRKETRKAKQADLVALHARVCTGEKKGSVGKFRKTKLC